ncbi:ankyrin repeat and protein kinase domain-containing protein [Aspergillus brunneoviolaceus CBS 621.78]|uniref:Kinase-like protein n=1 Tax=Aspergillus brunneoviolaceus CBS 621.78 TaxID=1450534 RepID=A0ACD1FXZ5_9EURO|nr:kinase-like protein [Aspergillus brunneoviolaceus CBS 621.78]RAH41870.1 kinase-like protein [Aspergillus brunneoviolaceus CBS 621.78]
MASSLSDFDVLCDDLRNEFAIRAQRKKKPHEKFIARATLETIWTEERRQRFLASAMPDRDKSADEHLFTDYIQTLSILVYINWSRESWPRFHEIFLNHDRKDAQIHTYTSEGLMDPTFLTPAPGDKFANDRYMFCPVDIIHKELIERSEEWRLPFEEVEPPTQPRLGAGASAEVICAHIAAGHFWSSPTPDVNKTPDSRPTPVAVKKFRANHRNNFHTEFAILRRLIERQGDHGHIVSMLGAVAVGDYLGILLPLAQTDLEKILNGTVQLNPAPHWSHLLEQSVNLAAALQSVHNDNYCHRDLKPSNVLVYTDNRSDGDSRAGLWKISDFGMAERSPAPGDIRSSRSRPSLDAPISAYEAPEVVLGTHHGSLSDVWSFGCILTLVIAFGVGSENSVTDLDERRRSSGVYDCFYTLSPAGLNPQVMGWINELPDRYGHRSQFLEDCKAVLLQILTIDPMNRPTAGEVSERLQTLINSHQSFVGLETQSPGGSLDFDHRLWEAIRESDSEFVRARAMSRERVQLSENQRHEGMGPLHYAIARGKKKNEMKETIKWLLELGAGVNTRSDNGMTPLMAAAYGGHEAIVQILLRNGAECEDTYCCGGLTSLHYAAQAEAGAGVLLEICTHPRPPDLINRPDRDLGATPLLHFVKNASQSRWDPTVKKRFDAFLRVHADTSKADKSGRTPLYEAIQKKDRDLALWLLDAEAQFGALKVPEEAMRALGKDFRIKFEEKQALGTCVELVESRRPTGSRKPESRLRQIVSRSMKLRS